MMSFSRSILMVVVFLFSITRLPALQIYVTEGKLLDKYEPVSYTLNYEDIEGSPYLNDTLVKGLVRFDNGDTITAYMRFNIYEDGIEYLEGEKIQAIDNDFQIRYALIGRDKMVYLKYGYGKISKKGYLIEKVAGKCKLYLKHNIKFENAEPALTSYHQPKPAMFVKRPIQWFVSNDGGPVVNLWLTKSELEEIFGNQYTALERYRKKEKLKLRREEDVILLFEYFNSIN